MVTWCTRWSYKSEATLTSTWVQYDKIEGMLRPRRRNDDGVVRCDNMKGPLRLETQEIWVMRRYVGDAKKNTAHVPDRDASCKLKSSTHRGEERSSAAHHSFARSFADWKCALYASRVVAIERAHRAFRCAAAVRIDRCRTSCRDRRALPPLLPRGPQPKLLPSQHRHIV